MMAIWFDNQALKNLKLVVLKALFFEKLNSHKMTKNVGYESKRGDNQG